VCSLLCLDILTSTNRISRVHSAYAASLRLSPSSSSLSLAFLNGASIVGRLSLGILSDRFSPWLLASTTLLLTAFAVFVLWGVLSYTFAGIVAYGIVYGCLAGGYSSLWTGFVRPIASKPTAQPSISTHTALTQHSRTLCRRRPDYDHNHLRLPHALPRHRQHPLYADLDRLTAGAISSGAVHRPGAPPRDRVPRCWGAVRECHCIRGDVLCGCCYRDRGRMDR
jgi:hypothetical protein